MTGSSRGIGRAVALRLSAGGARVVLHASKERAAVDAVAATIKAQGGDAEVVVGDLSIEGDVQRLVREAHGSFGDLGILILDAGGSGRAGSIVGYGLAR